MGWPVCASGTPSVAAEVATALRAVSLPFGVSIVAQAAATESLNHEPALLARVDALLDERARVVAGLREVGWEVPEPQGNFVWFALGERTLEFAAVGRGGRPQRAPLRR